MGNSRLTVDFLAALLVLALTITNVRIRGQFGPLGDPAHAPQAKSQEEFDAYLEILVAPDAHETIAKVEEFISKYPESELLATAYQHQMLSYQKLNEFEGMLQAGEKYLQLLPGNLNALLTLASAIPNATAGRPDAANLVIQAEEYARQALRILKQIRIPREIPVEDWERLRGQMEAQAHEALGHVAVKRGQVKVAVSEFEKATHYNPEPQGKQFFRLGVAYAWAGKNDRAERALRRAAELGPDLIRQRALQELKKLEGKKAPREEP